MPRFNGLLFDADNHYYEGRDAFTRHVPKHMQPRCVQWVTMEDSRQYHSIAGKVGSLTQPSTQFQNQVCYENYFAATPTTQPVPS